MTLVALRTWFLCTLLLAGLVAPPALAGTGECCAGDEVAAVGAASCDSSVPAAPDAGCCPSEASLPAPSGPPADHPADAGDELPCGDCDDCQGCDAACQCARCGCGHPGHVPAMRTTPIGLALIAPAAALAAPDRTWSARDDAHDLLRPPRR